MTRRRILFVDDEVNILDGLRNLLRRQRGAWDMAFALSGAEALALLEQGPFDVIVSDLRMPGMDGATLLGAVQARFPSVTRIVLSGHAERETVVRSLPVAHQVLTKPCEAEVLREAIERSCSLQALLHSEDLRAVVGRLDKLPSLPRTYLELGEAIASAGASAADIARIVESDSAMSAKVLQLANSGFFASSQRRVSVTSAVTFLGVELLKTLALTAHVFAALDDEVARELALENVQDAAVLSARLCRRLVRTPARADEAFTAGLVHDIGRVVLAVGLTDRYREARAAAAASGWPLHLVEKELLGVTHAEVGAYLLGVWGLPHSLVEVVAYHHEPDRSGPHSREVMATLHVAAALSSAACGIDHTLGGSEIDEAWLARVGVLAELPRWRDLAAVEAAACRAQQGAREATA